MRNALFDWLVQAMRGVEMPALEARLLLQKTHNKATLTRYVARRLNGEPVSKILHRKGFYKRDFYTSQDVLDPRPDSETLVEAVLANHPDRTQALTILDLGTGSGCLLLSLLDEYPHAKGVGIDSSDRALKVARKNAGKGSRARFLHQDWRRLSRKLGTFDIIVSNPPYIPTADIAHLDKEVKNYDPLCALDGGKDGLDAYKDLAAILPTLCHTQTDIYFEIGKGQQAQVKKIMARNGFHCVRAYQDLGHIIRVLQFKK